MTNLRTHAADAHARQYRFGDFTLDLDGGFLRRGEGEIGLRPKTFEVLTYLIERHGQLVPKTELLDAVWPDAAVTDNSLAQCLAEIRRALGDDSQQMIRTVARRGYVFVAPVTKVPVKFARSSGEPVESAATPLVIVGPTTAASRHWRSVGVVLVLGAVVAGGVLALRSTTRSRTELTSTQLTDFTDAVVAPALSPDGKLLAFIRGSNWFGTTDQIYVKLLPNGEPTQLTHDPRQKYGVTFSPDGSRIAYTAFGAGKGWNTYTVPVLGGEPSLLLANAAGLTWLDDRRFSFAEIKTGMHMGIVTSTATRSDHHDVYLPRHERAMAHYSYPSPDRRWTLVLEMDHRPVWQRCRLVPLDGSSPGEQVGPPGECSGAGWSPDGRWMYFTAIVDGQHHLWRQRFPHGQAEQMTSGPEEEIGVAVAPDGSIVTSLGMNQNAIWLHDSRGDRLLSSEGTVVTRIGAGSIPLFSPGGRHVYYLRESTGSVRELWRVDVESGRNEPVLPGIAVVGYDISHDGAEVVYAIQSDGRPSQLWIAPLDRSSPPRQIGSGGEDSPRFGPAGHVLYRFTENKSNFVGRIKRDGSGRARVADYPVSTYWNISPDRRWLIAIAPLPRHPSSSAAPAEPTAATIAVPTAGGPPRMICGTGRSCWSAWSPDGKFLYVTVQLKSATSPGRTIALPVSPETGLPDLPEAGVESAEDAAAIRGSFIVEQANVVPGLDPTTYAYVKTTAHRNLFRIHLP